ncbi:hypothetical protein K470DRAFT_223262, partial [Piedraia hortae CBS 480.64]
ARPTLETDFREEGFGALYNESPPTFLQLGAGAGILLVVFTGVMDKSGQSPGSQPLKRKLKPPVCYVAQRKRFN